MRLLRILRPGGEVDIISGLGQKVYIPIDPKTDGPTLVEFVDAEGEDEARRGEGVVLATGSRIDGHQVMIELPA